MMNCELRQLNTFIKSCSTSNAAIKNTASPIPKEGWYPAYSASGQDVWLPEYRYSGKGIVVSAVGARCGKCFQADGKWNVTANTHVLLVDESIADYKYCWYLLNNENWWIKSGSGQPFVKVKDSLNRSILLPDLSTQQHIAAILDKISEGTAVCGKMMDELDLMVKAKFVEMFGNIPETEFVTMGSVCSLITDGTHQPPKFVDSGIPFLFVSNITTNMLTYNAEKFISAETYAELMKRTPVEIGDILLSTVGSYGHPAIVKSNKQFSFQRHIAFLKPRHNIIDSTFLHSAILTAGVQRQIEAKVKGIAQKTLNLSEIRTLRFPLPPLQEQERYAALVKNINKSKLTIQEIRDKMETEKLALMQGYFG